MSDQNSEIMSMSRTISIKRAKTFEEYKEIIALRHNGYQFNMVTDAVDRYDFLDNCILLLAYNSKGNVVGTVRLLKGLTGPIELNDFIDLSKIPILESCSFVEATRMVVLNAENALEQLCTKLLLSKSHYNFCLHGPYEYMLMSSKDAFADYYKAMYFRDIGEEGVYCHTIMNNALHRTYYIHVPSVRGEYEMNSHPFLDFMLDEEHLIEF